MRLALSLLALAGCHAEPPTPPPAEAVPPPAQAASLAQTSWVAVAPDTARGRGTLAVHFGADGAVSGTDGCNDFSGRYTATDDSLRLADVLQELQLCLPEPSWDPMAGLVATATWRMDGDTLRLADGGGRDRLALVRDWTAPRLPLPR